MTVTPDVEQDVLEKLASLFGTIVITGPSRNAWAGPERGIDEGFPMLALFVSLYGGTVDWNGQDRQRWFAVQILVRSDRLSYATGELLSRQVFDKMDGLGPWTGASGAQYQDCLAVNAAPIALGPSASDPYYFTVNIEVWLEG